MPRLGGRGKRFVPRCWGKTRDVGFEEGQHLVLNGAGASDLCRLMRKGLYACEAVRLWPQTLRTRPWVTQLITLWSALSLSLLCKPTRPAALASWVFIIIASIAGVCRFPQRALKTGAVEHEQTSNIPL